MKKRKTLFSALIIVFAMCMSVLLISALDMQTVEAATISKNKVVMFKGETAQLRATVASGRTSWQSSDTKIAGVSNNGKVTGRKKGNTIIIATVKGKSQIWNVTVEDPKINASKKNLRVGQKYTLKVKGSSRKVKWTSKNSSIATVGSSNGSVTAKKKGSVTINGKIDKRTFSCKVTVYPVVKSVSLDASSFSLTPGAKRTLKATVSPSGVLDKITWTSSNSAVASVANGTVLGRAVGNTVITAKTGSKSAKCNVTVAQPPLIPTYPSGGLSGNLSIGVHAGFSTSPVWLTIKNNTRSSIEIEERIYLENNVATYASNIFWEAPGPTTVFPGAEIRLQLYGNSSFYADSASKAMISFYYNGYNYTATIGTTGAAKVESPTASSANANSLLATYGTVWLKEALTDITINRIITGTMFLSATGRTVPVCEIEYTDNGGSKRYATFRRFGNPSATASFIYHPSVGYIGLSSHLTSSNSNITRLGTLVPSSIINSANSAYSSMSYRAIGFN